METKTQNSQHFVCFDMDGKIYARTKTFDDNLYVDIRRFFKPADSSEFIPTRRGVCFNLNQWKEFLGQLDEISKALENEVRYTHNLKDSSIEVAVKQWKRPIQYVSIKSDRRESPLHPKNLLGVTFNAEGYKAFLEVIPKLNRELGL